MDPQPKLLVGFSLEAKSCARDVLRQNAKLYLTFETDVARLSYGNVHVNILQVLLAVVYALILNGVFLD